MVTKFTDFEPMQKELKGLRILNKRLEKQLDEVLKHERTRNDKILELEDQIDILTKCTGGYIGEKCGTIEKHEFVCKGCENMKRISK